MRPMFSIICNQLMEVKKKIMEGENLVTKPSNNLRVEICYKLLFQRLKMVGCALKLQMMATCTKISSLKCKFRIMDKPGGMKDEGSHGLQTTSVDFVGIDIEIAKGKKELQACIALGLVGMSGIGKTTLAKAILKSIQHEFDGHCFLENLKAQSDNFEVVKNVLHNFGKGYENIKDIQEARQVLVSVFKGKKLLIVLDDISNEQVIALNGLQHLDYGKGSKLIITTRSLDILKRFEVHVQSMYMSMLDESSEKKLFAKYAYEGGKRHLPYFKDIERKVIKACNGLPLNLMVMGAYLGKEKRLQIWKRALSTLLRLEIEEGNFLTSLKVSFDNLDNYEKKVFLDISQNFMKNLHPRVLTRSMAMEKWGFGDITLNRSHAIDVLVNRCLLKVDGNECLRMHDQLCYLGHNIVEEDVEHNYV